MEQLNQYWYSLINADANLQGCALWLAIILAKYLVIIIVLGLFASWFWSASKYRHTLILAFFSCLIALGLNWIIGLFWYHPRPFILGLGNTYLQHAPDSSFPSDHTAALFAISFVFLLREKNLLSLLLFFSACSVAWARIYLGIHFPFDILGGVIIALVASLFVIYCSSSLEKYMLPRAEMLYRKIFTKMIQKNWVNF